MLASALIVLSLTVTVLAVLDFLLSETQKKVVADTVIATWNVLDEARKWSFSDWLKNPRASWWLAITLGLFFAVSEVAVMHRMMMLDQRESGGLNIPSWIPVSFAAATVLLVLTFITRPIFSRFTQFKPGQSGNPQAFPACDASPCRCSGLTRQNYWPQGAEKWSSGKM